MGSVFFFDRPVLIDQHPGVSLGRKSQKQNHQNRIVSLRDKMAVANPIDLDVDLNQQSVVLEVS